jgi:hypothetical protein
MSGKYAENTSVSVARTKADIEEIIQKYSAQQFVSGFQGCRAAVGFTLENRQIRFIIELPDKSERRFLYTPERGTRRTEEAAVKEWEQACRQKWRALFLVIKAKLEAVDSGISCFEDEFMANIVLPDGTLVGEFIRPQVERAYATGSMPPLLPMLN